MISAPGLAGLEVVECAPPYDWAEQTALLSPGSSWTRSPCWSERDIWGRRRLSRTDVPGVRRPDEVPARGKFSARRGAGAGPRAGGQARERAECGRDDAPGPADRVAVDRPPAGGQAVPGLADDARRAGRPGGNGQRDLPHRRPDRGAVSHCVFRIRTSSGGSCRPRRPRRRSCRGAPGSPRRSRWPWASRVSATRSPGPCRPGCPGCRPPTRTPARRSPSPRIWPS